MIPEIFWKQVKENRIQEVTAIHLEGDNLWTILVATGEKTGLLTVDAGTMILMKFNDLDLFCKYLYDHGFYEMKLKFNPELEIRTRNS